MISLPIPEDRCRCFHTFDKSQQHLPYTHEANICKVDCFTSVSMKNTCAGWRYDRRQHEKRAHIHTLKINMHLNALVWALSSAPLTHISTHTCTYTWRAAHLANRPHYTGGWTIDPLVEELKKSPFSSLSPRMRDMMSWSYLPALCTVATNLTCIP